jgi:alginate O-acetyltransferase complex protein AlgI
MQVTFDAFDFFANLVALSIIVIPIYYALRQITLQRALLTVSGCYLVFCIAPRLLVLYLIFWTAFWGLLSLTSRCNATRVENPIFWAALLMILAPMVVWKVANQEFVSAMNFGINDFLWSFFRPLGELDSIRDFIIPIGLSFATFRALDLLIKTHLFDLESLSIADTLFYGFFPPVIPIGPIIEYQEIHLQHHTAVSYQKQDMIEGLLDLVAGVFKVYVLAYPLKFSASIFQNYSINPPLVIGGALLLFTFYFYFNFAGFSSIAIGLARLYGFKLQPNFNYPLFRQNPQAFWSNWHMSLTRFAQRYVFVTTGGYRKRTQYIAIYMTMLTIALWHDLTLQWLIFGLYHGTAIAFHRFWTSQISSKVTSLKGIPPVSKKMINHLLLICYVGLSFPIIMLPLEKIIPFYGALLGITR